MLIYIFDLDGTITKTQLLHEAAWLTVIRNFVGPSYQSSVDSSLYVREIDGRPRAQGLTAALNHLGVHYTRSDVDYLLDAKNATFLKLFEQKKSDQLIYSEFFDLVEDGFFVRNRCYIGTSSKNGRYIVEGLGLNEYFSAVFDGVVIEEAGVKGKPDPEFFNYIIDRIGGRSIEKHVVVVEDSLSGVTSGVNSRAGRVIWVSRHMLGKVESSRVNCAETELLEQFAASRRLRRVPTLKSLLNEDLSK
jgi:beta-phosphoglucomutase-like phosphatase (HAD superfamily)